MHRDCIHSVLILEDFFLLKDSLCNTFIVLSLPCIKAVINGPLGSSSYPAPRYSWKVVNILLSFYQIYGLFFSIVLALLLGLYQDRLFTHIIQYNLAKDIYSAIILHYQRSHFEMYKVNSTQMKLYHISHGVYK